jgi:hypothetical protein
MTNELYDKLKLIALKITKGDELNEDLFHDVLIQLANNEKYNKLNEKQKTYYFVRAIINQYYSTTSYFFKTYKKFKVIEIFPDTTIIYDEGYEDTPSIEWINEILDQELINNPSNWYHIGLFRMYMDLKNISKLHKQTRIPKYSIRLTIKIIKELLHNKWQEKIK